MIDPAQHLPRVFQNNLHRLYELVVANFFATTAGTGKS